MAQDIFTLLAKIPPSIWGTVVGAGLSLPALVLSLRHARQLQAAQFAHDAKERARERELSWKRDIYSAAAESATRLCALLTLTANIEASDKDLSLICTEENAKLSKVNLIANSETIQAVQAFSEEFAKVYLQLTIDRAILKSEDDQANRLGESIKTVEGSGQADPKMVIQHAALKLRVLQKRLALGRAAVESGGLLAELASRALVSVRQEMGFSTNSEAMLRASRETANRMIAAANASLDKVNLILEGKDPDNEVKDVPV